MELISDAEKRAHLTKIFHGWGMFTAQSLYVVPLIAKHRGVRINGVSYHITLPAHFSEAKIARIIYTEMPTSVSRLTYSLLGTEKLQRQITEPGLEEAKEPRIVGFYRTALAADLRLVGWQGAMEQLARQLGRSTYLIQALLRKVTEIYALGVHDQETSGRLRRIVGNAIAALRGSGRDVRGKQMSQTIQQLERRAMLRRLRIAAQEHKDEIDASTPLAREVDRS